MTILDELACKYGTDKGSTEHNYCATVYEPLFAHLRHQPIVLVELGIWEGASLKMWSEYFTHPDRVIVGVDNVDRFDAAVWRNTYTYIADQADADLPVAKLLPNIIIDDASHISTKTIASFQNWFPHLKPGGLYIVEDIVTSYYYPEDIEHPCNTAMEFFKRLADQVNRWGEHARDDIASICFHPNMVIIKKAGT
jgi:hypothetical protein